MQGKDKKLIFDLVRQLVVEKLPRGGARGTMEALLFCGSVEEEKCAIYGRLGCC